MNASGLAGHRSMTSKQTEADVIASRQTEMNLITSKQTEENLITSKQTEADTMASKQAETITLKQTEADAITSNPTEKDVITLNPTEEDAITLKSTEEDPFISNPTEEDAITSKSTEEDAIISNPTEEDAITLKPTKEDAITSNPTEEDVITSKPTEEDAITSNPTEEDAISSKPTEEEAITSNPTEEDAITSKSTEEDAIISSPTEEDAISSKPTEEEAITSNPTEEDVITSKPTEEDTITSNPTEEDAIAVNPSEEDPIALRQNEVDSAVDKPLTTCRHDTLSSPLNNTNNVSSLEVSKNVRIRNTNAVVGQSAITSNQTVSLVDKPSRAFSDDTLHPPLQGTVKVTNSEAMKNNTINSSTAFVGYTAITSNQTDGNSAMDYTITRTRGNTLSASLNNTNYISNSESMKNTRFKSLFGQGPITFNQTRTFRDDTLLSPLKNSNIGFNPLKTLTITIKNYPTMVDLSCTKANQTEADSAVDNPPRGARDYTLFTLLKDKNKASNFATTENDNINNSMAAIGHGIVTSIQTKVISALNNATTTSRDDALPAQQDTNNVSNSKTTEWGQIQNSNGVVSHSAITAHQTKANSTSNNSTAACRQDSHIAPLKDTSNISNYEETKIKNSTSVIVFSAITSKQTEADSALNKSVAIYRDNTLSPLNNTNNVSNSNETQGEKITVGHGTITSYQSKVTTVLDNPTTDVYEHDTSPSSLKETNSIFSSEEMKNKEIENPKSMAGQSIITSNQTKQDSAVNNPTTTLREDSQDSSLMGTNNSVYEEAKKNKIANSMSVIVYSAITLNQTESDVALNNPTTACRNDTLLAHLKDTNQTEADSALNRPATTCRDNSLNPPSKDTNNFPTSNLDLTKGKKINSTSVVGYGSTMSNQTKLNSVVDNSSAACSNSTLHSSVKETHDISKCKAPKKRRIQNSDSVVGHSLVTANQTKANSVVDNPSGACRNRTLPASVKETHDITNCNAPKKRRIHNFSGVAGPSPISANQTEANSVVYNPTGTCNDNKHPASVKEIHDVSNCKATNKRGIQNYDGVAGPSPISANPTEANSVVDNSTATCMDNKHPASVKETHDVSNCKIPKKREIQNDGMVGHDPVTANQAETNIVVDNSTRTCMDNKHTSSVMEKPDVLNCKAPEERGIQNSDGMVGYSPVTANQIEANSAVDTPTGTCRDNIHPASVKETHDISNCKTPKKREIQNDDMVGHSPVTATQTKANPSLGNPTTSTWNSLLALLKNKINISNSKDTVQMKNCKAVGHSATMLKQTESGLILNNPTTSCGKNTLPASLKDTNIVSKSEAMKLKSSKPVVGLSAIMSNQTNTDLDSPTTTYREDSLTALLKNTKNTSSSKATKQMKNSTAVVEHSAIISTQTESDLSLNNPTACRSETLPSPLKDTNNVSKSEETKNKTLKSSKPVVGHSAITSNLTKADFTVDSPTTICSEDSLIALLKSTKSTSISKAIYQIKNCTVVVGRCTILSKQTESGSNPTKACKNDTLPAPLKDTNTVSKSEAMDYQKMKSSKPVVGHSASTSNQPKVDSALDSPTTSCGNNTLPAPLKDTNTVSESETMNYKNRKSSKSLVGHSAITSNQMKADSAVDSPTTCQNDRIPSPLKGTNAVPKSEAMIYQKMKSSKSLVGHIAITSNQTKADSALDSPTTTCRSDTLSASLKDTNNVSKSEAMNYKNMKNSKPEAPTPTTTCREDSFIAPLKDTNKVSDYEEPKKNKMKSSKSAIDHSAVASKQTEAVSFCSDSTPSPPINVSNSDTRKVKKTRNSTSAFGRGAITSNQTKVDSAVDTSREACKDNTLPTSSKSPTDVSNSRAMTKKKWKSSKSAVDHGAIMPDQTEADIALNNQTTTFGDDSLSPPLNDTNDVANTYSTKGKKIKNSTVVLGSSTVKSNTCEADSTIDDPAGVCIGDGPTGPLNDTNTTYNSEATKVKKKKNAKENHGSGTSLPGEADSSLDNPSIDYSGDAPAIPLKDTDIKRSKSGTPKRKKKRKREKKHKCSECGKLFLFNAHLVVHLRSHTGERPFPCDQCGKSFASKTRLSGHQIFHTNKKPYSCTECDKSFYNNTHLQVHRKIHQNERPHRCTDCGKTFIHQSNFTQHQEIHKGMKRFLCSFCGKSFRQNSHLRSHQKQHTGDQRFSCNKCHMKFQTESALISHYKLHRVTVLSCPECDKHFINRVSFDRHRRIHTGHKLLSCSKCGKCFINKSHLSIHERIHSGEKPFACSICARKFTDKSACKRHENRHICKAPGEDPANTKNSDKQKTLPIPEKLTEHQKSHSKERLFSCGECDRGFANEKLLAVHQKKHLGNTLFSCDQCSKGFRTQLELEAHQKNHPALKPFLCVDCGRRFSTEEHLASHKKRHLGEKSCSISKEDQGAKKQQDPEGHQNDRPKKKSYDCSDCDLHFTKRSLLTAHQKQHLSEKRFVCSICKKGFKTQLELKTHQKYHLEDKPFLCKDCGRRFASETLLAAHQERHVSKKRYLCTDCGRGFNERSNFDKHCRIHTGEKPFSCSDCGKAFSVKSNMIRHRKIHTGERPYKCLDCGKSFRVKSYFIIHQKMHTGIREYACSQCPKTFRDKSNYQRHKKSHVKGKQFPCTECGKIFRSPTQLTIHARTHSRQKFECSYCGKNFKNNWCLNKHTRTHTRKSNSKAGENVAV
ncbi:uncharacterized protein ACMZJ9_014395 [Mantella aurantiaca]